jgi:hypothetical protein
VHQHPQLRQDLSHELRRGLDERAAIMAQVTADAAAEEPARRSGVGRAGARLATGVGAMLVAVHLRRRRTGPAPL